MAKAVQTNADVGVTSADLPEGGSWATAARSGALTRLQAQGLPGRRDEYWRFTRPDALIAAAAPDAAKLAVEAEPPFTQIDALRLVFVDGIFDATQSDDLALSGITIELLADATVPDIHWAKDLYGVLEGRGQSPVDRPLAALNTATATQGVVIHVTGKAAKPVSLRYDRSALNGDAMVHNVIRMESGSDLTLLESGAAAARLNTVLEVDIADGAKFHHVRTQGRDHERLAATHIFARLGTESSFKSFTLTANGALTRNESVVALTGDDAHCTIAGACVGDGAFHQDDTVFVTHDAVNCESRQVFKKVLRNGATGVFQGKILVKDGAQKTDGYQISQGLLLDDDAQFLAKPELEIYADDVICSHGSTCGAVDETALFYLTSRGIPRDQATGLLVLAFLAEAIDEIEDEVLADDIRNRLEAWHQRHTD